MKFFILGPERLQIELFNFILLESTFDRFRAEIPKFYTDPADFILDPFDPEYSSIGSNLAIVDGTIH